MAGKSRGLSQGSSFDLLNGWDLERPEDVAEMWRVLKKEDPALLILCPPCTAFSRLQEWNFRKMSFDKSINILKLGLYHLELAKEVAMWQVLRGGWVVFEHPDGARSWEEGSLRSMMELPGMQRVVCDMCMFGMNVNGEGLNKKSTGILTNCPAIARRLSRRCDHRHFHVPVVGGLPKKAQVYPEEFCREVIRGLQEQCRKEKAVWLQEIGQGVWTEDLILLKDEEGAEVYVADLLEDGDQLEEEAEAPVEAGEEEERYAITPEEKSAVEKLHKNMGHPQTSEMVRFMRAARVRGEIVKWYAREFRCPTCEARAKPKVARPAAVPRSFQPNKVIGVDLIYIPEVGGGTFPAVSIVDWGTNYQMVERIPDKQPVTVWNALEKIWFRIFGPPEIVVTDPGREFCAEFQTKLANLGVVGYTTGAKSPWQAGKTERHGGLFKELLEKARSEVVVTEANELDRLMHEVEQAKNRYSNRSGFSPIQRHIGQWPRVPGELLADDAVDPYLIGGLRVDEMERTLEMRRVAQKAFAEVNSKELVKRAVRSRSRVWQEFQPGEHVYVYRVPRARKRKGGEVERMEVGSNRAVWVGPGTVIVPDGANLWINMLGELWRVAREQCRLATSEEKHGIEQINEECKELIEEYKRNPKKAGYHDITGEEWPPEDDREAVEESQAKRRRLEEGPEAEQFEEPQVSPEYSPTTPGDQEGDAREEDRRGEDVEPPRRRMSIEEPETEVIPLSSSSSNSPTSQKEEAGSQGQAPLQWEDPAVVEAVRRSAEMSRRLDGISAPGPLRIGRAVDAGNPYWFIMDEEDVKEQEEEDRRRWSFLLEQNSKTHGQDFWEWKEEEGVLIRHHQRKRKARFDIRGVEEFPVEMGKVGPLRRSVVEFVDRQKGHKEEEDHWQVPSQSRRSEGAWWRGSTEFKVCRERMTEEEKEKMLVFVAERKRGADEVVMSRESEEDKVLWKIADAAEWQKVVSSGAVRLLDLEESRKVRSDLRREGKEDRILPSTVARRRKPAEQPGEPATMKSRLCIRGDQDPDILDVERFSPTLNTQNFNLLLQVSCNSNMTAAVADFKNAFCQSKPLYREKGPIYFKPPKEGIDGVHQEQIVAIVNGCYGLVDAPLHWRRTLVEDLRSLGYIESKLDPCIFKLHDQATGVLLGAIAVEVDDLFMVGHSRHWKKMEELRSKYTFGKWVWLREAEQGCAFNGRRIRQTQENGYLVDMQKFVEERLSPVKLGPGRASKKKDEATEDEVAAMRALCGGLNWLSKEGRPDAAGPASLLASKITRLKVEDILAANEAVKQLQSQAELAIQIQPLQRMRFSVVTDASFANDGFHSQGGHIVLAHEASLSEGGRARTNIVSWRSGKLQRVVNSTLAAETQSLSRGLADLMWSMVVFREFSDGHFELKRWNEKLVASEVVALCSTRTDEVLKQSLAIVDAKSLYDYLSKQTVGGQDKRTAIEVQIIREDLNTLEGRVRWVDHQAMIADGLTKLRGQNEAMYRLINSGEFSIQSEVDQLKAREDARASGQSSSQIRRSGIKEKGGCVKDSIVVQPKLIPDE